MPTIDYLGGYLSERLKILDERKMIGSYTGEDRIVETTLREVQDYIARVEARRA